VKQTKVLITSAILGMVLFATAAHADNNLKAYPLQAAVREYIEANMPWPPGTARVDFLSSEPENKNQDGHVTLRVEPAGNVDFIGDMAFLVRSLKGRLLTRTDTVRARIEVLQNVFVATRSLSPGTVLTDHDVRTIQKWVRRIHPQAVSSLEDVVGKRLSTQIPAGAEFQTFMLKEAPLVRKGRMVKVVFDNGPMQIITLGLSEEDGIAGSMVRVRNITSNKIIYARVLSDSLVGIEY